MCVCVRGEMKKIHGRKKRKRGQMADAIIIYKNRPSTSAVERVKKIEIENLIKHKHHKK